ncbi:MAG: NAD(P)-dependent dehydrogenase (short-subunit alcohol dehydrogenase family) [Ascidiaceihabitans sp.]|jgi:NAD(P)-dependent dehydrogenase (short-subunit alcohol dehydrogenase family)
MSSRQPPLMMLTGGSRGIGLKIAQQAQSRGWFVCLGLRDPSKLPDGLDPAMADLFWYDANDREAEAAWVKATIAKHGRIDTIVANAGLYTVTSIIDASEPDVDALLEVNLRAPRRLAMSAWSYLKLSGRGRVVILGSLSGKRVASSSSALYSVSKFAAIGLAHALRYEGWDDGIRATAICPGLVATDMGETASGGSRAIEEMTQPQEVARLTLEVIELSNSASIAELHINSRPDGIF